MMRSGRDLMRRVSRGAVVDTVALAAELEALDAAGRARAVRGLTKCDMVRLWRACVGQPCTLEDFVPAGTPAGAVVRHAGKNSLPAFSTFEKRFVRAADREDIGYGYNHSSLVGRLAGPGFFTARAHDDGRGEFGLNYYEVPPRGTALPRAWPWVRPNELGPQLFVYARMIDYMRKIGPGVTIGRAWRYGRVTGNYFVLARLDG